MSKSAEESISMSDEEGLSASPRIRAAQARAYTFQDVSPSFSIRHLGSLSSSILSMDWLS